MHPCAVCLGLCLWLPLLCTPAALAAAAAALCTPTDPVVTPERPEFVVGLTSSSASTSGVSSRRGLAAALSDASDVSRLRFVTTWLDNDNNSVARSAANARELVCGRGNRSGAFLVAATVGSVTSLSVLHELRRLAGPSGTPVPLFGPLTSSPDLRDRGQIAGADGRLGVVNVRPEAVDEASAVLSFLSRDVELLRHTAVAQSSTPYGALFTSEVLRGLESIGAHPSVANVSESSDVARVVDELLVGARSEHGHPMAVLVASTGGMTAPIIEEVVARGVPKVRFFCGSNPGARDVWRSLKEHTRSELARLHSHVYFQQHVPQPHSSAALIRDFWASINRTKSSEPVDADTLEGYIVGRLIAMAASRSLEIYGWPLTRQTFLDTVFRSYRTFDLRGTEFGPYGDGAAPQTEEDWCSHGLHEVFMDRLDLATGNLVEEPSSSFKFAGCNVVGISLENGVVVGFSLAEDGEQSVVGDMVRLGLSAALSAANSRRNTGGHTAMVANFKGNNATDNAHRMADFRVVSAVGASSVAALASANVLRAREKNKSTRSVPLVGSLSGLPALRFPFEENRNIINLVPLMQQEMLVAVQYILNKTSSLRSIAVVFSDSDLGRKYNDSVFVAIEALRKRTKALPAISLVGLPLGNDLAEVPKQGADAYIFAGKPSEAAKFLAVLHTSEGTRNKTKVLCSDVLQDLLVAEMRKLGAPLAALSGVRLLCSTPPLAMLPKANPARQQYERWVSEIDRGESSFRGFFVGLFLNAIIDSIDNSVSKPERITSQGIVDAVYRKRVFDVGGVVVGSFVNQCKKGTNTRCCNQGLDKVYVTAWRSGDVFAFEPFDAKVSRCGEWRMLSFLNIKRPDLEINECIGSNRFGQLHVGDWHGTTVAIRVITKKEVSKGDLATIKEEIGLLHKLHHPNLLMLMGYCETRNELYVVSEYMSGGSLKEYLARNRGQLGVFSLIAMAFDVVKGIAYLHASKPPIVHGSISTRSLLVDDKLTTKVSDFWLSLPMSVQVALHPEPDASTPKEVVELLYQCWEPQPDQRPTIFTVLRSWPSTFATVGRFELPSDLSQVPAAEDSSRTSGTGPDAVVPVAMMSHSEQDTAQSLHFEFQTPSDMAGTSVVALPSGFAVAALASSPVAVSRGQSPAVPAAVTSLGAADT
eukprot:m51a1_g2834 putative flag-tagged protein kinase domain of mitogen-activated protein kinase kinase kinase (1155) ;mRNA; f:242457-246375